MSENNEFVGALPSPNYTSISHPDSTFIPLKGFGPVGIAAHLTDVDLHLDSRHVRDSDLLTSHRGISRWDDLGVEGGIWAEFLPEVKEWFAFNNIEAPVILIYARRRSFDHFVYHYVLRFANSDDPVHFKMRWYR